MFTHLPDACTQARLHTLARTEAIRLRREAVDDFWRGAHALLQRGLQTCQALARRPQTRNTQKV